MLFNFMVGNIRLIALDLWLAVLIVRTWCLLWSGYDLSVPPSGSCVGSLVFSEQAVLGDGTSKRKGLVVMLRSLGRKG